MSVCIAVIAENQAAIVIVNDQKVDFGEFSADYIGEKQDMFSLDCIAMYAGNDSECAEIILKSAKERISGKNWTPEIAAESIKLSCDEYLQKKIASKVLSKYHIDVDTFLTKGRTMFTPAIFTTLCSRIENVKLSLRFLLCGFERHTKDDSKCKAHIYEVSEGEAITCRDNAGMWAIGAGNYLALSSLAFAVDRRRLNKKSSLPEAVYCALEAKFMAESNGLVGKNTSVGIITPYTLSDMKDETVNQIRATWEQSGVPKIPDGALKIVSEGFRTIELQKGTTRAERDKIFEDARWKKPKELIIGKAASHKPASTDK